MHDLLPSPTRTGPSVADPVPAAWREFLTEVVSPGAAQRDASATPIPRGQLEEAGAHGILGAHLPTDVGGAGLDARTWGAALEGIGYWCDDASFPLVASLYVGVGRTILATGREELIERYVRPLGQGEALISFAYTEDADPFSFATTVRRDGEELVLNGEKRFVTGGQQADAFMVYARSEGSADIDVVIVEAADEGVAVDPVPVMGVRAAGLARLRLAETRVPAWRAMQEGGGLSHVQRFLNARRGLLCCAPVGRMERLLEQTVDHVASRVRYGRRLADMQNVQAALGRMKVQLETARSTLHWALSDGADASPNEHWSPASAVAKHAVTESALALSQTALRITGGQGYAVEGRFERDVRDFHGLLAGAGAQDILEVDLGTSVVSERERTRRYEA